MLYAFFICTSPCHYANTFLSTRFAYAPFSFRHNSTTNTSNHKRTTSNGTGYPELSNGRIKESIRESRGETIWRAEPFSNDGLGRQHIFKHDTIPFSTQQSFSHLSANVSPAPFVFQTSDEPLTCRARDHSPDLANTLFPPFPFDATRTRHHFLPHPSISCRSTESSVKQTLERRTRQ